jgi:hypothetical protein
LNKVTAAETRLGRLLTLAQPVERRVQLVSVDRAEPELLGQGCLPKLARAGQPRAGLKHPLHDHRHRGASLSRSRRNCDTSRAADAAAKIEP